MSACHSVENICQSVFMNFILIFCWVYIYDGLTFFAGRWNLIGDEYEGDNLPTKSSGGSFPSIIQRLEDYFKVLNI